MSPVNSFYFSFPIWMPVFSFYFLISLIEVIFIKRLFLVLITLMLSFILLSFETLPTTLKGEITSGYGDRINPITKKKEFHNAVDIAAEKGTPILSPVKSTRIPLFQDSPMMWSSYKLSVNLIPRTRSEN